MSNVVYPGEHVRENYRAQGRRQEQERIIKLLEENANQFMNCWDENYDTAGLIALIKGENNAD
jgi:hypothetical protein